MNIKTVLITLLFIPFVSFSQIDYELDIQPILNNNNCTGCHSGPSPSAGIDLTNIESVMASGTVIDGDYENSLLWQVVETGYMPFGSPDLSLEEVNIISQWISELGGSDLTCDISFLPSSPTGTNNTIAIQNTLTTDLEIGDEIGLFYINDDGLYTCSSTFTWIGETNALTGFGDDSFTTEIDGFSSGGEMYFLALTEEGTIHQLSATYDENPPFSSVWVNNGFSSILSLTIIDSLECGGGIEDLGCTDETACNYDVLSTIDDGSCILPAGCDTCSGEIDGTGTIINNDADGDGICDPDEIFGCTNPLYEEYDPLATEDDGSCSVLSLDGCTDPAACNYNENATENDGSCILPVDCDICSGETDGTGTVINNDLDGDGICDADEVTGCQDATACNYNENATENDASCILPVGCDTCSGETDGTGTVINNDADGDGVCDADEVAGCQDVTACNYNENATDDNGLCTYPEFGYDCLGECVFLDPNDPNNCISNYEPIVITNIINDINNNQVTVEWTGGLSIPTIEINLTAYYDFPQALSYNIDSNLENNGSYTFDIPCSIILDANNDGIPDENDIFEYAVYVEQNFLNSPNLSPCYAITNDYSFWGINLEGIGCNDCDTNINTCPNSNFYTNSYTDLNQVSQVNLSICAAIEGCTDSSAFNYNSEATLDDGSCCLISGCPDTTNILYNPEACFFDANLCINIENCDDITIIPFATVNNVSCYNESDGSIEVIFSSIFGGTPPYTVLWEGLSDSDGDGIDDTETQIFDPNNDGILENLSAGNYKITIVDDLGCPGTTILSLTQPQEIIINYDTTEIECNGEESIINLGIEGDLMEYDVYINDTLIETVDGGSTLITSIDDFNFTNTGSNNSILIFGCDDDDCSDSNGIITPGDVIGVFYESSITGQLQCGGSATFSSVIPFGGLTAWQTEPGQDNGFVDGENYVWYLYDTSGTIYELIPNYDLDNGIDYFSPGSLTVISDFSIGTILGSNDDFTTTLNSGEYLIEVIGENGCSESETIIITEPNELNISNETISNPTCSGAINGFINITIEGGTGEYIYEWTGPLGDIISTSEDLTNLSPGTYTILITDENGCLVESTYEINNPDEINVDYDFEPISCSGESTILNVNISGGESPYTIDYDGVDPNNISSGFYTFSVTDNLGCLTIFEVSITEPSGIAIDYPAVETVCVGETNIPVDFSMSISGGNPPYIYEWFDEDGTTLGIFTPNATISPGNYSIVVSDEDGCESISYPFEITEPEEINVITEIIPINCFGETGTANFSIDGAPGTYTIYFNDEEESTTIGLSDISFEYTNTGSNHIILVNSINDLALNVGDIIGVFYTSGSGVQCGGSVTFDGTYPFTIPAWAEEPGEDNGFENGEDFLFLINSGGLVYEVDTNYSFPDPTFSDSFEINGFSDVELNVTGVFSEGPDFSFTELEEGEYFVEIVDGNNCSWTSSISISGATEIIVNTEIISDASCSGELAQINTTISGGNNPYTFQWQTISTGEIVSTLAEPELAVDQYFFIVTDDVGCSVVTLVEINEFSGDIDLVIDDESCSGASDGSVLACVEFSGDITFELWNGSGIFEQINITSTEIETCYQFDNLNAGLYDLNIESTDGCSISEGINISSSEEILVSFSTSPAQCYNEPSGQITINNIIGGNPPYEIDWEGIDTEAILPGYHSFIITDQNNCSKTFNYFIGQPTEVVINPIITNNNCFGGQDGSISVSVVGGDPSYNYIWTNSNGLNIGFSSSISNLASGIYTLQVTDSSGCIKIENYEIIDLASEETVILLDTEIADCFGGFGSVSAEIFNQDNSNFTYIWPNGITNNGESVNLLAGNYELTVLNNISGCINEQNFTIQEPNEFIIEVSFEEILCFEDLNNDGLNDLTTIVEATIYGGADEDIDGDGVVNTLDNDIDGDGIVNILDSDIDGDGILNINDDNNLIWINGDIDNDGIVNDEDIDWDGTEVIVNPNNLQSGIYYVYSYDSKGCYSITEFEINSPEELLLNATANQILCYGEFGSGNLMISGGVPPYDIIWTNEINGDIVDPSMLDGGDSGLSYIVEVTDQNGCISTDEIFINEEPEELIIESVNISDYNGFSVSCNGESDGFIEVTANGGTGSYNYIWSNGSTSSNINNLSAGEYIITVTDENNCEISSVFEIIEPDIFEVIFTWVENSRCEDSDDGTIVISYNGGVPPLNYTINNSIEISGGIVNSDIYTSDQNIVNTNSILLENLNEGIYLIEIISDQNSCIEPIQQLLDVNYDDENCLWIPTVFSPNNDGVNDTFEIYGMEYYPNATVEIYNRWGQLIYESKNQIYIPWDGKTTMDNNINSEIATYYYIIELNTGQKTYNGSITLKR